MDSQKQERKMEVSVISAVPNESNVKTVCKSKWHVNREMLPFKLHFLLFISSIGVVLPYYVVFAKNRVGLSTTSVAALLTAQQFVFILTKPLICYIADYFNKLKLIIIVMTVLQTVFLFLLLPIPKINTTDMPTKIQDASGLEGADVCDWYDTCKPLHFKPFSILKNDIQSINKSSDFCIFFKNNSYNLQENSEFFRSIANRTQKDNSTSHDENQYEDDLFNLVHQTNYTFLQCARNKNDTCAILTPTCFLCCRANDHCSVFSCAPAYSSPGGTSDIESINDFQTYQFWSFAIVSTLGIVCANGMFTLSDTACSESVKENGADFGRQRLYGAIGWGASAVLGGFLNDYTDDYLASWILMGIISILTLWNIKRMKLVKPQFSQNIMKDVGTVLASKEYLSFASIVFMCGMGIGIIWFYLIWFLTTIGGSSFLCGLTHAVQCFIGEIPFMFFSGWMIKKLGYFNVLTLALVSYCIRFAWYSNLQNPWLVLPVEIFHGFTYGLFYPTLATYAKSIAKPGTEATSQAVLFTVHEGLGAGLGCILTGISIDRIGSHRTFFFASIFCGCGAVLSVLLHLLIRRQKIKGVTT